MFGVRDRSLGCSREPMDRPDRGNTVRDYAVPRGADLVDQRACGLFGGLVLSGRFPLLCSVSLAAPVRLLCGSLDSLFHRAVCETIGRDTAGSDAGLRSRLGTDFAVHSPFAFLWR